METLAITLIVLLLFILFLFVLAIGKFIYILMESDIFNDEFFKDKEEI